MARFVWPALACGSILAVLAGCSFGVREERPAWRLRAEEACLAQHLVEPSAFIQPHKEIDGPGICGLVHPFKVTALLGGTVAIHSDAILSCSMIPALEAWLTETVEPAAQARFGEPVVRITTMGTYSCRGINNESHAKLSEHAFGNAMDVGAFVLASGREISVVKGWKSADEQERAFLREAHAGACGQFTTVLGPGYNAFHYNHFHIDLAMHGNTSQGPRRYCKPVPEQSLPAAPRRDLLPDPPTIEEDMDIAAGDPPRGGMSAGAQGLALAAPEPPVMATPRPLPRIVPTLPAPTTIARAPSGSAGRSPLDLGPRVRVPLPEGMPRDWDVTSSIAGRQATR